MLSKKAYYGYEILQELSKYPIIHTKESTIYPLLRRLLKENYLTSFWQETTEEVPSRLKNKKAVKPSIYATFQLFPTFPYLFSTAARRGIEPLFSP